MVPKQTANLPTKTVHKAPIRAILCMRGAMLHGYLLGPFPAARAFHNGPKMDPKFKFVDWDFPQNLKISMFRCFFGLR